MPPAFIRGGKEGLQNIQRHFLANDARAQGEHISVVMRAGEPGGGDIVHQRAADGGVAVGGHAHADAGAADKDAKIRLPGRHRAANGVGEVRVVDTGGTIGTEIQQLWPASASTAASRFLRVTPPWSAPRATIKERVMECVYHEAS